MAEKKTTTELNEEQAVPVTVKDILEIVRTAQANNGLTKELVESIAGAIANAASPFENRHFDPTSVFNPLGDVSHPRDDLRGDVYWAGFLLTPATMTRREIELTNQLSPGVYNGGAWRVINLEPGVPNLRRLLVLFPCTSVDQRNDLPRGTKTQT